MKWESDDTFFNLLFLWAGALIGVSMIGAIIYEAMGEPGVVLYSLFLAGGIGSVLIHSHDAKMEAERIKKAQQ